MPSRGSSFLKTMKEGIESEYYIIDYSSGENTSDVSLDAVIDCIIEYIGA